MVGVVVIVGGVGGVVTYSYPLCWWKFVVVCFD